MSDKHTLRGVHFGRIACAAGVNGYHGEGWRHHTFLKRLGLTFAGMTFASKTVTLLRHNGNEPLTGDSRLKYWWRPRSIKVNWRTLRFDSMVNAFGLSNYGLGYYLPYWQELTEPFWISVTSIAGTEEEQLTEHRLMTQMLLTQKRYFQAPFGIQIDSCPLFGVVNKTHLLNILDCYSILTDVPKMPKFNVLYSGAEVVEIARHPECDAICVSNTVPADWADLDLQRIWGSSTSPLQKPLRVAGGLSGKHLKPLVIEYIRELQDRGLQKTIHAGGGIMSPADVLEYFEKTDGEGKTMIGSIFVGTVANLRPWRMRDITETAKSLPWHN